MATKLHIAVDRANAGTAFDIAERLWDAHSAGASWSDALTQEIADRAIERYQKHIRAGLARAGVFLDEGEKLDSQTLLRIVQDKTGLTIDTLTPDAVAAAVKGQLSARLSEGLGIDIGTVQNGEQLKAALIDATKRAVMSGRANGLITSTMIKKIRALKAWRESGIDPLERQRLLNRAYQKAYRRTHREVWRGSPAEQGAGMHGYPRDE